MNAALLDVKHFSPNNFRLFSSSADSSPDTHTGDTLEHVMEQQPTVTADPKPSQHANKKKRHHSFVPRKAAVALTETSRTMFQSLLDTARQSDPTIAGIQLNYDQSKTGEPRMVYTFDFVRRSAQDGEGDGDDPFGEAVSLELVVDPKTGNSVPKTPADSQHDGLPKLYVSRNAFLKVLGATVDVDPETLVPILYDREGNKMDPNA
jgi:hypothetical protein